MVKDFWSYHTQSCSIYLQVEVNRILTFFFLQIAGDLLDLVGDGAFETVQDLIMVSLACILLFYLNL